MENLIKFEELCGRYVEAFKILNDVDLKETGMVPWYDSNGGWVRNGQTNTRIADFERYVQQIEKMVQEEKPNESEPKVISIVEKARRLLRIASLW